MEAFLFPPNSLLSIDLPGIYPLSHIPPFQTSLKKNILYKSQSYFTVSTIPLHKKTSKRKSALLQSILGPGTNDFLYVLLLYNYSSFKDNFFVDVLPFLKVAQGQNMSSYTLLPDTKYRSRLTVHVQ